MCTFGNWCSNSSHSANLNNDNIASTQINQKANTNTTKITTLTKIVLTRVGKSVSSLTTTDFNNFIITERLIAPATKMSR